MPNLPLSLVIFPRSWLTSKFGSSLQLRLHICQWPPGLSSGLQFCSMMQQPSTLQLSDHQNHGATLGSGCFSRLTQLPFLDSPGSAGWGWHRPRWAGPSHSNWQLRKCPTALSDLGNSSVKVPSFPVSSIRVKLTKTNPYCCSCGCCYCSFGLVLFLVL